MLEHTIKELAPGSSILDFGCFGWNLYTRAKAIRDDLEHHACDAYKPHEVPEDVTFYNVEAKSRKVQCDDDQFDLVVASHVLEHIEDPLEAFKELARICKPGGKIYIETPSDRSVLVKSDPNPETHTFFSFWDDPTHIRPWSPAALYRLSISYGFMPIKCAYLGSYWQRLTLPFYYLQSLFTGSRHEYSEAMWRANKWGCGALLEKPTDMKGAPEYVYLSLRDVPHGAENAMKFRNERR
jgi:SAM-dependent methyltransferase